MKVEFDVDAAIVELTDGQVSSELQIGGAPILLLINIVTWTGLVASLFALSELVLAGQYKGLLLFAGGPLALFAYTCREPFLLAVRRRQLAEFLGPFPFHRSVSLEDRGIHVVDERAERLFGWSTVRQINDVEGRLTILTCLDAVLIPVSSFGSDVERNEFKQKLVAHVVRAKEQNTSEQKARKDSVPDMTNGEKQVE